MKQVRFSNHQISSHLIYSGLIDICMSHTRSDSSVKYMSVFFHVYHVEKILASIKEVQHFDNASINAHVNLSSLIIRIFLIDFL